MLLLRVVRSNPPPDWASLLDRLRHKTDELLSRGSVPDMATPSVAICADPESSLGFHEGWLTATSFSCRAAKQILCSMLKLRRAPAGASILLVDLDQFDDLDDTVQAMIDLRRAVPDLVVIVASHAFGGTDLSLTRAPIADASVKLPVSRGTLGRAIAAAQANHRVVRLRS